MSNTDLLLAALFFAVAVLYSSVGHAGASGYIASMALLGFAPELRSSATSSTPSQRYACPCALPSTACRGNAARVAASSGMSALVGSFACTDAQASNAANASGWYFIATPVPRWSG